MPRMARIVIPNPPHHVTRRGNKSSVARFRVSRPLVSTTAPWYYNAT